LIIVSGVRSFYGNIDVVCSL